MTKQSIFTRARPRIIAVLTLATAVLVTIVVAGPRTSHALPGKNQTDLPLSDAFAVLRRPAGSPPPPSLIAATTHVPASFGLNLSAARRSAGTGAWLIPGAGLLCLAVRDSEGLGISCASTASAERGELAFEELSSNEGASSVIGALPDWLSHVQLQDGIAASTVSAAARENTYVASGLRAGGPMRVAVEETLKPEAEG